MRAQAPTDGQINRDQTSIRSHTISNASPLRGKRDQFFQKRIPVQFYTPDGMISPVDWEFFTNVEMNGGVIMILDRRVNDLGRRVGACLDFFRVGSGVKGGQGASNGGFGSPEVDGPGGPAQADRMDRLSRLEKRRTGNAVPSAAECRFGSNAVQFEISIA